MHGLIPELGVSLLAATVLGFLFQLARQPVILGYLVAGAVIGPELGLRLVANPESVEVISEIGLILLLFIIGLELHPKKLVAAGRQLLYVGVGQFILCVLLGLAAFLFLGFGLGGGEVDALYLAIACALSSTAIVVKLLYDKFELDTLPGRLSIGILIFQDLWAILVLALQPHLTAPKLTLVALALGKSLVLLATGFALSRYVLGWVFGRIAKTPEMVVAMSIAWCVFMAGAAAAIDLSMEMGALIAGVAISTFPYSVHVTAKVLPLRDSFLTLFFLAIGMKIPAPDGPLLAMAGVVVLFVLASRFLTIYPILALLGSGRRTAFITSLNLAQISEFSLVVAALGVELGHIEERLLTLIIYAMALTSVLTSYFIKGNHTAYVAFNRVARALGARAASEAEPDRPSRLAHPIVLLGFHRGARAFLERVRETAPELLPKILVIDFNLEVLKELKRGGVHAIFGDISSLDTLEHAHVADARVILSTIPDMLLKRTSNRALVTACRALAPHAVLVACADSTEQADALRAAGANEVLMPYALIGDRLATFVAETYQREEG